MKLDNFAIFRPWSLTATLVPFMIALALAGGGVRGWRAALALAAAACLQTACNLFNTYGDDKSGVDAVPGAYVSTPQLRDGAISRRAVRNMALAFLAGGCFLALPLFFPFRWPLLAIAAAGVWGAANYATGFCFKYRGLGVVFVFSLMGWLECAGFIYAMRPGFDIDWPFFLLATLPLDCHVAAILHGNDMRDIESDSAAGIKTLSILAGWRGALNIYRALHIAPYAVAAGFAVCVNSAFWAVFAVLPLSLRTLRRAATMRPVRGLERESGLIHLIYGLVWAAVLKSAL